MELGILGWPSAGKTTLFDALTGQHTETGAFTSATHTAVVRVPDPRVQRLSSMFQPKKTTYAEITFIDPAAERNPALERPSFPEALLAEVRDVDALVLVVRAFEDPAVPRPPGSKSPEADLVALEEELILRDTERVENRLARIRKEGQRPETALERGVLERALAQLESEKPLREQRWSESDLSVLRGFQLLSLKPALVILNVSEDDLAGDDRSGPQAAEGRPILRLCAQIERELVELDEADRLEYLAQLGLGEPARDVFVRAAFRLLDLISFFTVGEDEVRAWSVQRDAPAPVAAGRIHSDLQKGFIRAEVIHYDEFVEVGTLAAAKSQGLLRLEGKQYHVQDGDIMHVRHA